MSTDNFCFGCEEFFNEKFEDCFTCSQLIACKEAIDAPFLNMEVQVIETSKETPEEKALVDIMAIIENVEAVKTTETTIEVAEVAKTVGVVKVKTKVSPLNYLLPVINAKPVNCLELQKQLEVLIPNKAKMTYYKYARIILKKLIEDCLISWNGETKSPLIWI